MQAVKTHDYVYKRNGRYVYRRVVPEKVQAKLEKPRKQWFIALKTRRLDIAERKAANFAAEHDKFIEDVLNGRPAIEASAREIMAKGQSEIHGWLAVVTDAWGDNRENWPDHVRAQADIMENGDDSGPQPLPISQVYQTDLERHEEAGGGRSELPIETAIHDFIAIVGDKDIRGITFKDADEWISAMRKGIVRSDGKRRPMTPSTIRRRVGAVRAVVSRAYRLHSIERPNPFSGHDIGGTGTASDRLPLTKAHLDALRDYLATNKRLRNENRRIIRIMMGTGADVGEIGGLTKGDIKIKHEVPHIIIRPNKIRTLKAEARERRIPLVGDALTAAKQAVVGLRRPNEKVFEGYGRHGRGADALSAKLNKVLRAAGIAESRRLTSKSLRHSITEALRAAGAPEHVARRLLGHSAKDPHQRYGTPGERLAESAKWLSKAIDRLGDVDESGYTAEELRIKVKRSK